MSNQTVDRFRRWFWRPPRVHGDVILDRRVSFLELFYDLVYVVVISQATHHLAASITVRTVLDFAVVFSMIVVAWVNGTFYLELHGREDGRTRALVFVQMGILAVLAVFTGDAGHDGGRPFALVYAAFLVVTTLAWYGVRRQDRRYRPEYLAVTGRYLQLLIGSIAVLVTSAFLSDDLRLIVWAAYSASWLGAFWVLDRRRGAGLPIAITPTESLVERFDLFTIIVLGEVILGVVSGMSLGQPNLKTVGTGVIALLVGFGLWWIYFDLVGHRLPRKGHGLVDWVLSHFPITLSIAAGGAAMVSLIAHAHEDATPPETAWLLSGAVALGLVSQIFAMRSLVDAERLAAVYRPMSVAMAVAAAVALALGWLRPAPWLFATGFVVILSILWLVAVALFIRADAWGEEQEGPALD